MTTYTVPYSPRPLQLRLHRELGRFNVVICHRRFGKTVFAINHIILSALHNRLPSPRYGYYAPTYSQAEDIAWGILKSSAQGLPGFKANEAKLQVEFDIPGGDRATIRLYGAGDGKKSDRLKGRYLDGGVLDEAAQIERGVWTEVIRPMLVDRQGWVIMTGTPKGYRNLLHEMYERAGGRGLDGEEVSSDGWRRWMFKASTTGLITQEELALLQREMSEEEYAQEMECSFDAALIGSFFVREMDGLSARGQIGDVPYNPSSKVWTAWDLGIDDATVIWFVQPRDGGGYNVIDCLHGSGMGLLDYIRELHQKPYVYGGHFGPHDLAVREYTTGKTRLDAAAELGVRFTVAPGVPLMDGIEALRRFLPMCWFDKVKCGKLIDALRQYRREWRGERLGLRAQPLHDWTSHFADAGRVLAVCWDGGQEAQAVQYRKLYGLSGKRVLSRGLDG